ncbi:DUF5011 domain-containing protein [Opitutales bacterium]|nr:DUF5011 domain-containing protein [Opitutales bacterium]
MIPFVLILLILNKSKQLLPQGTEFNFSTSAPISNTIPDRKLGYTDENDSFLNSSTILNDSWCETLPKNKLLNHESLKNFDNWLQDYDDYINKDIHDSRISEELIKRGEYLAKQRAFIFEQIIKAYPENALKLAINKTTLDNLPRNIRDNLESWVHGFADITSLHFCFSSRSPHEMIKRKANFQNGSSFDLYAYGKRKLLPSIKNLSVWGVSLNNKLAMSEDSFINSKEKNVNGSVVYNLDLGGEIYSFSEEDERKIFANRILQFEKSSWKTGTIRYPLIASSTGETFFNAYFVIQSRLTWEEANATANAWGAKLVTIQNNSDQVIIGNLLKRFRDIGNLPSSVEDVWTGGEYNATSAAWEWIDDTNFSNFSNWGPSKPDKNQSGYGIALDITNDQVTWYDANKSERKFALIEFETGGSSGDQATFTGRRKILVIPARFYDEGNYFENSSGNPIDENGNPIDPSFGDSRFEPDSKQDLIKVMEDVQKYYLRNSDQNFHLDFVISPTVTLDYPKWEKVPADTPGAINNRIFDSTGLIYRSRAINYDDGAKVTFWGGGPLYKPGGNDDHTILTPTGEPLGISTNALSKAAQISEDFVYGGLAFNGVTDVLIPSPFAHPDGNFSNPRLVFSGGAAANGDYHRKFKQATAEAHLIGGKIYQIRITDTGSYYQTNPTLTIFDSNKTPYVLGSGDLSTVQFGSTAVSWVFVTTHGQNDGNSTSAGGGLGFVGAAGSHVTAQASAKVMAHELGHNFGLNHANKLVVDGYNSIGDENSMIEYGNDFSMMGTGPVNGTTKSGDGDLTIVAKGFLPTGYKLGNADKNATDIVDLGSFNDVNSSPLREKNAKHENTFRIYRHDYGYAPYPLLHLEYDLNISNSELPTALLNPASPSFSSKWVFDANKSLFKWKPGSWDKSVSIGGPGEGANANLYFVNSANQLTHLKLDINETGKGYSEEPSIRVLDENNQTLLILNPEWFSHGFRDLTQTATRGIRGVRLPANKLSTFSKNWFAYRKSKEENGLFIYNGSSHGFESSSNFLIDSTPLTPGPKGFTDAALMIGRTFSEYDNDVHITPTARGGIDPMDYIDVVVNIGTVEGNLSSAPKFNSLVSNSAPAINEHVEFTIEPLGSNYSYSWYFNEVPLNDVKYLNRRNISIKFSSSGYQVVKVVVSDMKGGIASENITLKVGDAEKTDGSVLTGRVKSESGSIQGAKVVLQKAPIITHKVRVSGDPLDTRITTDGSNELKFVIDNVPNKQILMNRGEIHRFKLEQSSAGYPLTFFDQPDHEPPKIKLNPYFNALVEFKGNGYKTPPKVSLEGGSNFNSTYSTTLTNIYQISVGVGQLGTRIYKPHAKSLLSPTTINNIYVAPYLEDNETGEILQSGGYGHLRDFPPTVKIYRSSFWEDYNEQNASAVAVVDGVGTINHVNYGGSNYPGSAIPTIIVNGAGTDFNGTSSTKSWNLDNDQIWQKGNLLAGFNITNQGREFDPNSTLAVALYPNEPFLYFSFDENEGLYESNTTKYNSPSPAFNDTITLGLKLHWALDDNTSMTVDSSGNENNVNLTDVISTDSVDPISVWGTKNRGYELGENDELSLNSILDSNYTVSCWLSSITNNSTCRIFPISGSPIIFSESVLKNSINDTVFSASLEKWFHLACTRNGDTDTRKIYINGEEKIVDKNEDTDLQFTSFNGFLLDEVKVYNRVLNEAELKQLSGKLFLDLSGNRLNGVPMGNGFSMVSSAADSGVVANSLTEGVISSDLGNAINLDGTNYIDISNHSTDLLSLRTGSIAFWINPQQTGNEMSIFSASDSEDNGTYYRLFLNESGSLYQEFFRNGEEIAKLTPSQNLNLLNSNTEIDSTGWHHIVITTSETDVEFYIDGMDMNVIPPAGSEKVRTFFSDLQKADSIAIGRHKTSISQNFFKGLIDEFHIYNRVLTSSEINYLISLGLSNEHVLRARLDAEVDAVGTIKIINHGQGYQEVPEIEFDYNSTIYNGITFGTAFANPELNATSVEKILLTQKLDNFYTLELPNGRLVERNEVEIVDYNASPLYYPKNLRIPEGIPGFTAPPNVLIGSTEDPNGKYDAEGYGLLYLDENNSAEITKGGLGFDLNSDSIYSFVHNNSTYEIVKINKSWANAASLAKQWGGKLVEINDLAEQAEIEFELLNAGITNNNTSAADGGGGAYLWIGGNDFANEGNWTWDGKNEGNGTQFWDGNGSSGAPVPGQFTNWGPVPDQNGDLVEPDDYQSGQDALAISLNGWPYGLEGQWNDLSRTNNLFFIVEYEDKPLDSISARLFASAVRIYGQGYRPPKFEAIVENGGIKKFKLIQSGEGYYSIDSDRIYYIGDGDGSNGTAPELNPINKADNLDQQRNNVEDNSLYQVTNLSIKKGGGGWLYAPNVYLDWNNPNHDVYPENLDFNLTLSHVEVRDPGYGYSVPLKIEVLGGYDNSDSSPGYVFRRAVIEAISFDSDLGITDYRIIDPGIGYIFSPSINITGGGGMGATAFATINPDTGQVISVESEFYGRGYRNVDSNQTPTARIVKNSALVQGEKNATVELHLGGALMEPEVDLTDKIWSKYKYPTPWFEILDRARPDISAEDKAEATAKVVDGNITKVIVTKSGNGYIDPYIKVYATPPDLLTAIQKKPGWRCTQSRQNKDGNFSQCGHVQIGNEPPQNCPGEEDLKYRFSQDDLLKWRNGHAHELCPLDHDHGNGNFKHHSCPGGAETFKLINDPHRDYDSFKSFNLECSAITENGKIREIIIDKNGSRYFSPTLAFSGTGGLVDAIPVFNREGKITRIFYDDDRIKNLEFDIVTRPSGAGQGFTERPYTYDYKNPSILNMREMVRMTLMWDISYMPNNKPREDFFVPSVSPRLPNEDFPGDEPNDEFPVSPSLQDAWGDRVLDIKVIDYGLYEKDASLSVEITNSDTPAVEFNATHANFPKFLPASGKAFSTFRLTDFNLDTNGTYIEKDIAKADNLKYDVWRGTFTAQPSVEINGAFSRMSLFKEQSSGTVFDSSFDTVEFTDENQSNEFMRLNGGVDYNFLSDQTYFDLIVDDRFPNKLYYGLSDSDSLSMGGEILVQDGMLGLNWGTDQNWTHVAHTDANGNYVVTDLDPGVYNIAVIMEDEKFQDITFRPDSKPTAVSRSVYVSGFAPLTLQADGAGNGMSALVWSEGSRLYHSSLSQGIHLDKELHGIGAGFKTEDVTMINQLIRIEPYASNTGKGVPSLTATVSSADGSLVIQINDTVSSSTFDINDKFTVSYASTISGIDFSQDFDYLDSNNSYWGGNRGVNTPEVVYTLSLSPQANGSNNALEVPISTNSNPDQNMTFTVTVFDKSGNDLNSTSGLKYSESVRWEIIFDDNTSDVLDPNKTAILSTFSGSQTTLSLFSNLRNKGATIVAYFADQNVSSRFVASQRNELTSQEEWLDQYFYTVRHALTGLDSDQDGLSDSEEWKYRTNPLSFDTDGDDLNDSFEVSSSNPYPTNPRNKDTDGDGYWDSTELIPALVTAGFNPLIYNANPPRPTIEPLFNNGNTITQFAGDTVSLGAKAVELNLFGLEENRTVIVEGNFSTICSKSELENIWNISSTAPPGNYEIIYSVRDSVNRVTRMTQQLTIQEHDNIAPTITLSNNGPIYILKGELYSLPIHAASDNRDGPITEKVSITGIDAVDVNTTGTYDIIYSVKDDANNSSESLKLQIIVEKPAFQIAGKAIDGYLSGSTVIFDSIADGNFDGNHDLNRTILTDQTGSFNLQLTTAELSAIWGDNQVLDPDEARIIVTGGYDPTIESNFTGRYEADPTSTVVSPLSTLVTSIMDSNNNLSKSDAIGKVKTAFGLTSDPTIFDPLAAALDGNESAKEVLLATARLANLMKQADALAINLSAGTTNSWDAGSSLINELAKTMSVSNTNPLDDRNVLINSLTTSLPSASTSQISNAVTLLEVSDDALVSESLNFNGTPVLLAKNLAKNQQAIEESIIEKYTNPDPSTPSLEELVLTVDSNHISNLSSLINTINVFPPEAQDFNVTIRSDRWSAGALIFSIPATDGDEDSLSFSIQSANADLDADEVLPFSLSASTGDLKIDDLDDLLHQAGQTISLKISISDGQGMTTNITGNLTFDNKLSLTANTIDGSPGWTQSWLGPLFSNKNSWIYHPSHKWLNVSSDSADGYWLWDEEFKFWWWTKSGVYPYFYISSTGWNYWKVTDSGLKYYNYQTSTWYP